MSSIEREKGLKQKRVDLACKIPQHLPQKLCQNGKEVSEFNWHIKLHDSWYIFNEKDILSLVFRALKCFWLALGVIVSLKADFF